MPPGWLLDISRSISRLDLPTPTGIDRVEAAYAAFLATRDEPVWFLARVPGGLVLLDRRGGAAVLAGERRQDLRSRLSRHGPARAGAEAAARALAIGRAADRSAGRLLARHLPPGVLALNVGHANLSPPLTAALRAAGARVAVMLHDTIPLDHPEFCRKGTPAAFALRLRAAAGADLVLANSAHTAARAAHWLGRLGGPVPPIAVLPLGTATLPAARPEPGARFVVLGTIEPRKNHALLLDIWEAAGPSLPVLCVIGRRGWEIAALTPRLDAAAAAGRVRELPGLDDAGVAARLRGARALLLPSFAEGAGLPLAEALAAGVPAVASDLPALRETGGAVPLYLDPRDRPGWTAAIRDLARPESTERARQLTALQVWAPISWQTHFGELLRAMT